MISQKTNYSRGYTLKLLLLLLLICITAYWPVAFNVFSLKNDALNYFLPVRHLISESIYHGYWPLWTPYLNLGYPLHGDMQSGVWNPVVQLFSLTGPYTLYKLQLETLLYIYLSGVGMFFLLRHFAVSPLANLFGSVAFMLCGYNSDSAQFLNWISGTAWLPFVFLFYYRSLTENNKRWPVAGALFLFLLFTSAYPADFILTAYLLFVLLIWFFIKQYREQKNILFIKKILLYHLLMAVIFITLSLPAILSYLSFLPLSERGGGANYAQAMSNPYHPVFLFSYLTPPGVWKINGFDITDGLERNSYFGIITLLFLLALFSIKMPDKLSRFFKWGFFISLLFSFGEMGGLRVISYFILPLMDTFRHPANAKLFTIFFACILGAFCFQHITIYYDDAKIALKKSLIAVSVILFILTIWALAGNFELLNTGLFLKQQPDETTTHQIKNILSSISFSDLMMASIIIQLPFLYLFYRYGIQKYKPVKLVIAGISNCILFAMLAQPFTVVKKNKAATIQNLLNTESVTGYPKPGLQSSLFANSKNGMKYYDEIGCLNLYNKKIGRTDYRITPSNLLSQNNFWFNRPLMQKIMGYPLLYRADTGLFITDMAKISQLNSSKKIVIIEKASLLNIISRTVQDTTYYAAITGFSPNEFNLETETKEDAFFVLLQNYYPNWKLYIDDKLIPIEKVNLSFIGFLLKKGKHRIHFIYEAGLIKIAAVISSVLFVILIFLLLVNGRKNPVT